MVKVGVLDSFFKHEALGIGFGIMIGGQHFAHLLLEVTLKQLEVNFIIDDFIL
jgi:hypothetical protein